MADAGDGELGNALHETERVPPMTRGEKSAFWAMPASLTLLVVPLLAVTAYGLIKVSLAFWPNSHWYFRHPDRLKMVLAAVLEINAYTFVLVGALLVYPAFFFRKMLRRKRETGSVLPQGEELAARRRKSKSRPLWKKLAAVGFFVLIAVGVTHSLMTSPHRHVLINWSFPALFWLIAVLVAVDAFFPSPDRVWTGIAAIAAFGLLAVLAVAGNVRARTFGIGYWIFPLLMASFSAGLGIDLIRDAKRKHAAQGETGGELT